MLRIVRSNRTERLFEHLLEEICRPRDPLTREVIVLQDMGMARWLAHRIAEATGVAANLEFLVPAELAHRLYKAWFGTEVASQNWSKDFIFWSVLRELPALYEMPECRRIKEYLGEAIDWARKYQLAKRIAEVFHRYLVYRPEMIIRWEEDHNREELRGKHDDLYWQVILWRRIAKSTEMPHQARLYAQFCESVREGRGPIEPEILPERVFVFGVTALAPVHVDLLEGLSRFRDVTIYHLNPCREYWGDIPGRNRDEVVGLEDFYRDQPNPMMASWAQAGRFLLDRLLDIQEVEEVDCFEEPSGKSMLEALQLDILNLDFKVSPMPPPPDDRSLQIHVCHSPMREIQVLHDRIAALLEERPHLSPEDFVVMAPDIDVYAPYVEAVFGSRKDPKIPWNLSERLPIMEDPLLESLVGLLKLPRWRCTTTEIMSLLERIPIARRFGLDEVPLNVLRRWVGESGIRWGIDGDMKVEIELPGERANTWRMGLERLLAGYSLPPGELFFEDVLSYPHVEGTDAEAVGGLCELIDRIAHWRKKLSESYTPAEWRLLLNDLIDDFFFPDPGTEASIAHFRRAVDAMASSAQEAGFGERVPVNFVESFVRDFLSSAPSMKRFLSGGVTFCNLSPMRAIPFKVVWILGMNGGDFPRADRSPSFDLVALHPRRGDRFRPWEDRFLFLEAFISAREVFAVSYVGRDIRENSEKVPSVLVLDLMDAIDRKWPASGEKVSKRCIVEHPLQPFNPRIYSGSDDNLFSYDPLWCVDFGGKDETPLEPFCGGELGIDEVDNDEVIELNRLVRFFDNPARYFLENSLRIVLPSEEKALEDVEPFNIESLDKYILTEEATWEILRGSDPGDLLERRLRARGVLPHGEAGRICFETILGEASALALKVKELAGEAGLRRRHLLVDVGEFKVKGIVPGTAEKGCLLFRPGKIRGKDRIRLWIYHLLLCCSSDNGEEVLSVFVGREGEKVAVKHVHNAGDYLKTLVDLWKLGRKKPLPFFPNSSWVYAKAVRLGKSGNGSPEEICGGEWNDRYNRRGEYYDPAVRIAFRGREALNDEFCRVALEVFGPMIEHIEDEKKKRKAKK